MNASRPLRALIWCAVSSLEQARDEKESIPAQRRDLTALCEQYGYEVVDTLVVPGFSRSYLDIYEFATAAAAEGIGAGQRLLYYLDDPRHTNPHFDVFVVRDADRFGRSRSLLTRIAETILIRMDKKIHTQTDGLIDKEKASMWIVMSAYKAAGDVESLVKKRYMGMPRRAERGLAMARKETISHRAVYDDRGNEIGLAVNRDNPRLWDDLATLLLEGVAWNRLERELFERFGHGAAPGKPYPNRNFYDILHTPVFWGHSAWNYRPRGGGTTYRTDTWAYDETEDPPPGVTLHRNRVEPVYTGELAEKIKAELRRRRQVRGRQNPRASYPFSGLLVCAECGYRFSVAKNNNGYSGYRCNSRFVTANYPERICSQRASISERTVKAWFDTQLRLLTAGNADALLPTQPDTADLDKLRDDIEALERQAHTLIAKQATAPASLSTLYDNQLETIGKRLESARQQLDEQEHRIAQMRRSEAAQVLARSQIVDMGVESFWKQDTTKINQTLALILGDNRISVLNGKIIGYQPALRR